MYAIVKYDKKWIWMFNLTYFTDIFLILIS